MTVDSHNPIFVNGTNAGSTQMCFMIIIILLLLLMELTHTHTEYTQSIHADIPSCMLCSSACTSMTFVIFIHVQTSAHARTHTHAYVHEND